MRGKVGSDFYLGIGAIVLAGSYIAIAARIQDTFLSDTVGASGVPTAIGWLLVAVGVLLCLRSLAGRRSAPSLESKAIAAVSSTTAPSASASAPSHATEAAGTGGAATPSALVLAGRPHLRALGLLAILACFPLVSPYLGYPIAVSLLMAAVVWYVGGSVSLKTLLLSIAAGAGFWLLFSQVLRIPLPAGVFAQGF